MRKPAYIALRGIIAGLVGATVLALWFLIIDTVQRQPFHTPAFLATILAGIEGVDRSAGLIVMYTALHYSAFILVGLAVAWLMTRLETAPSLLLGLVLGFLMFDLVFYGGVLLTGVDVVDELGWPEVFFGNLLAGMGLMGYLHLTMEAPSVTWWQTLHRHRIVREGIIAGLIGAAAVAIWFLIFDAAHRQILFTPGALGSAIFLNVNDLADVRIGVVTVAGYTILHVAAFVVAGLVAAAIVVRAEETPSLIFAAILIFAAFEAFFVGVLALVAEWLLGALAWWSIAVGNLVATVAMAYYLWHTHPKLQAALREQPLH